MIIKYLTGVALALGCLTTITLVEAAKSTEYAEDYAYCVAHPSNDSTWVQDSHELRSDCQFIREHSYLTRAERHEAAEQLAQEKRYLALEGFH
jgi:hypothetical protein